MQRGTELWGLEVAEVLEICTLPKTVIRSCCWEGSVTVSVGRKDIFCLELKGLSVALDLWISPAVFPVYLRAAKVFASLCVNDGIRDSKRGRACVLCPCHNTALLRWLHAILLE